MDNKPAFMKRIPDRQKEKNHKIKRGPSQIDSTLITQLPKGMDNNVQETDSYEDNASQTNDVIVIPHPWLSS